MKSIRRQYRNYKVRIKLTEDSNYFYGRIYRPDGMQICPTSTRHDEDSVMEQAKNIIDQDIREQAAAAAPAPLLINKITAGYVIQTFNTATGKFTSQFFTAASEVDYEDAQGKAMDTDVMAKYNFGPDAADEPYLPFTMVQPKKESNQPTMNAKLRDCQEQIQEDLLCILDHSSTLIQEKACQSVVDNFKKL